MTDYKEIQRVPRNPLVNARLFDGLNRKGRRRIRTLKRLAAKRRSAAARKRFEDKYMPKAFAAPSVTK